MSLPWPWGLGSFFAFPVFFLVHFTGLSCSPSVPKCFSPKIEFHSLFLISFTSRTLNIIASVDDLKSLSLIFIFVPTFQLPLWNCFLGVLWLQSSTTCSQQNASYFSVNKDWSFVQLSKGKDSGLYSLLLKSQVTSFFFFLPFCFPGIPYLLCTPIHTESTLLHSFLFSFCHQSLHLFMNKKLKYYKCVSYCSYLLKCLSPP